MATGSDVLQMLIPTGGWVIYGDDFDSIIYDEGVKPLTKTEFESGFNQVDAWKTDKAAQKEAKTVAALAKLAELGLSAEDISLIIQS